MTAGQLAKYLASFPEHTLIHLNSSEGDVALYCEPGELFTSIDRADGLPYLVINKNIDIDNFMSKEMHDFKNRKPEKVVELFCRYCNGNYPDTRIGRGATKEYCSTACHQDFDATTQEVESPKKTSIKDVFLVIPQGSVHVTPGNYTRNGVVKLLRAFKDRPDAIQYIADMMEK